MRILIRLDLYQKISVVAGKTEEQETLSLQLSPGNRMHKRCLSLKQRESVKQKESAKNGKQ